MSVAKVAVKVLDVRPEVSDDVDEDAAYWVTAQIGGLEVELYAAPSHSASGVEGLEPCGSSVDDWCAPELISKCGVAMARELGREAIAKARIN